IPSIVFQLAGPRLAHFLRTLFDMGVTAPGPDARINYSTVSERHARQMQHLLLRFGVIAKLSEVSSDDEASGRHSWRLEIADAYSLGQVYSEIRLKLQPADAGDGIEPGVERGSAEPQECCVIAHQAREAGGSFLPGAISSSLRLGYWLSPASR